MRSEAWKEKCEQRRRFDGYRCCVCGRPALLCREGLQVHHLTYERLGNEDVAHDIVSLCGKCHKKLHKHDLHTLKRAYEAAGYSTYEGRSDS